jgi:hypothetical protein
MAFHSPRISDMRRIAVAALLLIAACSSTQKVPPPAPGHEAATGEPAGTPGPGETVHEYDLNHDGRPDVWTYTVKGTDGREVVVRKEKDLNNDGKIDSWEEFAPDGTLTKLTYDMDFDGKPDVALYFEKDQLVRKEYAFGFDGIPRTFSYYEKNKLVRKERDTHGNGKIDIWEYWENGEVDRIGIDLDGDGQVDRWESRKAATAPATTAAPR